ncbi:uncharacterized protein NDAI_0A02960 [Naumovozyma dairenensis CBS 421]|uniref:Uncharacterized protein n=1 Tax=Naumovozyma dairenensis (strain ATCC 10597 / BCRC 20456 / CBS 421 / NBRC 0211 / NRRL Y-12639) TaxID=1071378 RepID=G0W3R5_NAUDC|nr:hypothetical protein NDAI_0A02960 [Naumovozyma dairenensis CBS 421]CCD22453.1 hypothetical protein NDAI_0A02960 [Naumovozyma dairenensis CBS 421]
MTPNSTIEEGALNVIEDENTTRKLLNVLPGKDIPSIRDLVLEKQHRQKNITDTDEFTQRMEDTLIKWRPSASQNRGSSLAVDGAHPFQISTPKFERERNKAKYDMYLSKRLTNAWDSLNNWLWDTSQTNNSKRKAVPLNTSILNIFPFNTEVSADIENDEDCSFDLEDSTKNLAAGTPIVYPLLEAPRPAVLRDREIDVTCNQLTSIESTYQQYYNNPIPIHYIDLNSYMNQYQRQHGEVFRSQQLRNDVTLTTRHVDNEDLSNNGSKRSFFDWFREISCCTKLHNETR